MQHVCVNALPTARKEKFQVGRLRVHSGASSVRFACIGQIVRNRFRGTARRFLIDVPTLDMAQPFAVIWWRGREQDYSISISLQRLAVFLLTSAIVFIKSANSDSQQIVMIAINKYKRTWTYRQSHWHCGQWPTTEKHCLY